MYKEVQMNCLKISFPTKSWLYSQYYEDSKCKTPLKHTNWAEKFLTAAKVIQGTDFINSKNFLILHAFCLGRSLILLWDQQIAEWEVEWTCVKRMDCINLVCIPFEKTALIMLKTHVCVTDTIFSAIFMH